MSCSDDNCCAICLEQIDTNTCKNHMFTDCGHLFHTKCFLQNAARNGYHCPMCRTELADVIKPQEDADPENTLQNEDILSDTLSTSSSNNDYGMDFSNHVRHDHICLSITEITNKLLQNGITMRDVLALFIGPHVNNLEDCDEFNVTSMRQINRLLEKIITNQLDSNSSNASNAST